MIHLTLMNTNIAASCSDLFPNRIKLQSELEMQVEQQWETSTCHHCNSFKVLDEKLQRPLQIWKENWYDKPANTWYPKELSNQIWIIDFLGTCPGTGRGKAQGMANH